MLHIGLDLGINSPCIGLKIDNNSNTSYIFYFIPQRAYDIHAFKQPLISDNDNNNLKQISIKFENLLNDYCYKKFKKLDLINKQTKIINSYKRILESYINNGYKDINISIENYAFGSPYKSLINLCELGGTIKYINNTFKLNNSNNAIINTHLFSPCSIKKEFTLSGKSNKLQMYTTFNEKLKPYYSSILKSNLSLYLDKLFKLKSSTIPKPYEDIIDTYALLQCSNTMILKKKKKLPKKKK